MSMMSLLGIDGSADKSRTRQTVSLGLVLLMVLACPADRPLTYDELDSTNVLVRVNGEVLTKEGLELQFERNAVCIASDKLGEWRRTMFRRRFFSRAFESFVEDVVIRQAGGKKALLKGFDETVEEGLLDECIRRAQEYDRSARKELAEVYQMASNVWREAIGGADFPALAASRSADEYAKVDSEWGTFTLEELEDEELAGVVSRMQVGSICAPVRGDNGLLILKLVGRNRDAEDSSIWHYTLQRIAFRLPMLVEMQSREEIREDIRIRRRNEWIKARIADLRAKAKVEYPFGSDVLVRSFR